MQHCTEISTFLREFHFRPKATETLGLSERSWPFLFFSSFFSPSHYFAGVGVGGGWGGGSSRWPKCIPDSSDRPGPVSGSFESSHLVPWDEGRVGRI